MRHSSVTQIVPSLSFHVSSSISSGQSHDRREPSPHHSHHSLVSRHSSHHSSPRSRHHSSPHSRRQSSRLPLDQPFSRNQLARLSLNQPLAQSSLSPLSLNRASSLTQNQPSPLSLNQPPSYEQPSPLSQDPAQPFLQLCDAQGRLLFEADGSPATDDTGQPLYDAFGYLLVPAQEPQEPQEPQELQEPQPAQSQSLFVDEHQRIVGPSGEPLLDAAGRPLFVFGGRVVTGQEDALVHLREPYNEDPGCGDVYGAGGEYLSVGA